MIKFPVQEALKSSLETSVVPSFEVSCKAMFEQVDTTFQRGMAEHTSAAQHQFESSHSPLALALRVSFIYPFLFHHISICCYEPGIRQLIC